MEHLIKVIVNNLTKINNGSLLELDLASSVELQSCGVDKSKISDVELSIDGADHELGLPELLVVWNMEVTGLSLSNLVNSSVSLDWDLEILQLLSVN